MLLGAVGMAVFDYYSQNKKMASLLKGSCHHVDNATVLYDTSVNHGTSVENVTSFKQPGT